MRTLLAKLKTSHTLGLLLLALVSFSLPQCGDDDDDGGGGGGNGDTRPILEIHMLENVTVPRPAPRVASTLNDLSAPNGLFYRGEMGSDSLESALEFILEDSLGVPINGGIVNFTVLEGDGTLAANTDTADAAGQVSTGYGFSGDLGHAVMRVFSPNADTVVVYIRANTLIPGATGQGQYVRFTDTVQQVIDFNGFAEGDVPDPNQYLQYVEYVNSEALVVLVADEDSSLSSGLSEPVVGVILTEDYTKTTAEGIGIGSTYDEMIAAYGQPDSVGFDGTAPATDIYFYKSLGLNIYVEAAPVTSSFSSPLAPDGRSAAPSATSRSYRSPVLPNSQLER